MALHHTDYPGSRTNLWVAWAQLAPDNAGFVVAEPGKRRALHDDHRFGGGRCRRFRRAGETTNETDDATYRHGRETDSNVAADDTDIASPPRRKRLGTVEYA